MNRCPGQANLLRPVDLPDRTGCEGDHSLIRSIVTPPLPERRRAQLALLGMILVGASSLAWFGADIGSEPHFVDESAYISQAYFADLWLDGRRDDPAWLEYPGYDLPPLPKYLIGVALRAANLRRPGRAAAFAWYRNTSTRPESSAMLAVARRPSAILGALGCTAIFAIGLQCEGFRVGTIAAGLLAVNPLYRMHARRAMSDVPAEGLILACLAVGLWALSRVAEGRRPIAATVAVVGAGLLGGLATLAKLNGALGLMTLVAWGVAALGLSSISIPRKCGMLAAVVVAGVTGLATFVLLNPFLTARPTENLPAALTAINRLDLVGRARFLSDHRISVSAGAARQFPHNALGTPVQKIAAVAVQGFGRFGPLGPRRTDSTRRFDPRQDAGMLLWLPIVLAGGARAVAIGIAPSRSGATPTAWAIPIQAALATVVVTTFIPLAWDRYYLSIQSGAALLAAFAIVGLWDRFRRPRPAAGS